ncbi:MAG: hypothetical protein JWQ42_4255 [Edaphobacter sp.]|nr:hypothetical protein [Edaphobacter sp.]
MYAFQPRIGYSQLKETGGNGIAGTAVCSTSNHRIRFRHYQLQCICMVDFD